MRERRLGFVLGWRWFVRPTGTNRGLRWRRIIAAAVAAWVALLGATMWQANGDRADRGRAQEPRSDPYHDSFQVFQTDHPYRGDLWTTIFMGGLEPDADAATVAPPGVPGFLAPGRTFVSPAVRRALARDPLAAGRVPGRVVGTIGKEGLQSPDQHLVYTGRDPGPGWWHADGWGSEVVAVPREGIPHAPLLGLVGILVGLPAVLLARATARMSAVSRQRSLGACHLLGIPSRALASAAALEAFLCALVGSWGGVGATVLTVLALQDTHLLGVAWFPPPTIVGLLPAVVICLALPTLISRDAARLTRQDLHTPLSARAGGPRPTRRWALAPLLLGIAGLSGVLFAYVGLGRRIPNDWIGASVIVGPALAALGALSGLPVLLKVWSRRLRLRDQRSVASFVARRRLSWQRDALAPACIGLTIVGLASLVCAGVIADVDGPPSPATGAWSLQVAEDAEFVAALEVPGVTRMVQVTRNGGATDIADCATLATIVGIDRPGLRDRFADQCRPGQRFTVAADGLPGPTRVVLPAYNGELSAATIVAADPGHISLPPGERSMIAFPRWGEAPPDDYISRILAVAPDADLEPVSLNSLAAIVPPTRRLTVVCTIVGLLTAAALLVLCAIDQRRRGQVDDARLVALGATRRLTALIQVITFGRGAAAALGIGLLVGGLSATVYDRIGGLVDGPGRLGVLFTAASVVTAAFAVLLVWLTALPEHRGALSEELRRE